MWFMHYAEKPNGFDIYTMDKPKYYLECDLFLLGDGEAAKDLVYTWTYSHKVQFPTIHELEAVNLLVAYATFAHKYPDHQSHVIIFTENEASANALQSGRSRDSPLAACARELWLLAAKHDHVVSVIHKPGRDIPLGDALSRMMFDHHKVSYVHQTCVNQHLLNRYSITMNFSHPSFNYRCSLASPTPNA